MSHSDVVPRCVTVFKSLGELIGVPSVSLKPDTSAGGVELAEITPDTVRCVNCGSYLMEKSKTLLPMQRMVTLIETTSVAWSM